MRNSQTTYLQALITDRVIAGHYAKLFFERYVSSWTNVLLYSSSLVEITNAPWVSLDVFFSVCRYIYIYIHIHFNPNCILLRCVADKIKLTLQIAHKLQLEWPHWKVASSPETAEVSLEDSLMVKHGGYTGLKTDLTWSGTEKGNTQRGKCYGQ